MKSRKELSEDTKQTIEKIKFFSIAVIILFLFAAIGNAFAYGRTKKRSETEENASSELVSDTCEESGVTITETKPPETTIEDTERWILKPTKKITKSTTTNPPKAEITEKEPEHPTEPPTQVETEPPDEQEEYDNIEALYSPPYFKRIGVIYWNGWRWTWYSERVLPGTGLHIPGRHTDEQGYIRDGDGYICVASDVLSKGNGNQYAVRSLW